MAQLRRVLGGKQVFLLILIFLILTDLAIFLGIPFLRQFLGLLFFTITPGLLILYILRLNKLGLTEKLVLSVGLSISFSMFAGLLINLVYPLFGYTTPLSTISVVISFSVILLILIIVAYLRNQTTFSSNWAESRFNTKEKAFLLLPALFPLLSILGMRLMNATGNNVVLIVLLSLIPAYVIWTMVMHRQVSERIYPAIIFFIGISFVLLVGLRSNHIIGRDTNWEYYFFQLTLISQHWQVFEGNILDACLSISLLPTIYHSFLNINPEYLYKILYPILFAVSPLVVYIIAKKYIGNFYAFLASFFFISQFTFYWTAAAARSNLAVLFFLLVIMVLFHEGITEVAKRVLFMVFGASVIVSHYSTGYVFFFILLFSWLGMQMLLSIVPRRKKAVPSPESHASEMSLFQNTANVSPIRRNITINGVMLFFVVIFLWNSQLTGVAFSSGVSFIVKSFTSLQQFFLIESRAPLVAQAFGQELGYSHIPGQLKFVFSWLTMGLIGVGILSTLVRYKRMVSITSSRDKPNFLQSKIDAEYFILSLVCSAILVLSLVFPYVSIGYSIARVYFQIVGILAVFLIIGGTTIAKFLQLRAYWLILPVLIPFFLCNAGLVDQIFNRPILILNSEGPHYNDSYIHDHDSYAAKWLRDNGELEKTEIYADGLGSDWLISQAGIFPWCDTHSLFEKDKNVDGYIYLRYDNVINGKLFGPKAKRYDIAEIQDKFIGKSKIYTNGGSEIYR